MRRYLPRLALLLILLIVLWLAGAPPLVAAPTLALDAPSSFSGLPLQFTVEMSEWSGGGVRVEVYLDKKNVGQQILQTGKNELSFPDAVLTTGTHELYLSAGTLSTQTKLRVLPGWLTIVPPLIAIALALWTRDVLISLFLGIFGGAMILNGWNPAVAFARTVDHFILNAMAEPDHAAMIIFTTILGGMIGLISKSGGTHGIVAYLQRFATSNRRGQLATWAMGVFIFFDDYANTLIVGPTMRPITDKLRISREKLAYVVDSTAAPVVCLFPISTWIGFEVGLIADAFSKLALPFDAYTTFLYSIPYRFYPIFALVLGFTLAATGFDFGPMRRAEERTRRTGQPLAEGARPIFDFGAQGTMEPAEQTPKRAINALVPILTLVGLTLLGLYLTGSAGLERVAGTGTFTWARQVLANANSFKALMWASLAALLAALLLPLAQRILSLRDAMGAMIEGFRAMLLGLLILILAWSIGDVCGELHTAHYLVGVLQGKLTPLLLPSLTFLLAAGVSFATGTSWGTMAIMTPLVIPICHTLAQSAGAGTDSPQYFVLMLGSIAAVLAGSVWGDHCSPISDTTILSSMASGCDHMAHVATQLPYALAMGVIALLVGSIPAALGIQPWICVAVGTVVIVAGVVALGRRQKSRQTEV